MAPESTMAVVLIESERVIGAVKSLTSWYGVIAETTIVLSEGTTLQVETESETGTFSSAGATGSVGRFSFLTPHESSSTVKPGPKVHLQRLAPPLRPGPWVVASDSLGVYARVLHIQNTILPSIVWPVLLLRGAYRFGRSPPSPPRLV